MRTVLFSVLIAITAACSTTSATDDGTDQIDSSAGKADGSSAPAGGYKNATPHIGELETLTLNDDHTFASTQDGACTGGGTCAPAKESGTYLFTHSSTKKYIRFYAEDGTAIDRFQYKMSGTKLELELDGDTSFFSMSPSTTSPEPDNSCDAATDCKGLVPDFCRTCTDGTESCAHWSCDAHSCEITSCD